MTAKNIIDGRFEIGPPLGEGGMGQVFRGVDRRTGNPVAIKRLKPEMVERQPEAVERFEREGEALRRLDHPNIVKILAVPRVDGALHIVMELVEGGTLADLLRTEPRIPIDDVFSIGLELADALSRAHHLDIVHRDLKPGNVLLTKERTPRLTDFGIARFGGSTFTAAGVSVGTYGYMSPEVIDGHSAGPQADVWSFGVLLYEMLAGRRPFAAERPSSELRSILSQEPTPLGTLRPETPAGLIELIHRMLDKSPDSRISSMRLVGAELEAIWRGGVTSDGNRAELPTLMPQRTSRSESHISELPPPQMAFIGREKELDALSRRLECPDVRLLTIVGAGGMGKTRLAIELARRHASLFPDGVFFVPLSSVTLPEAVVTAIGESAGYRFAGADSPEDQLFNFLRAKRVLLLLDNFEHLLDRAPLLAGVVDQAPGVKVLVTSRERLSLRCEEVYGIEGFDVANGSTADEIESNRAVQLFLQSARSEQLGRRLDENELATVLEICRAVHGMPLAIELAAGWLEALSPEEILVELRRGFDFLESDLRDLPERHRSLRAVFESSWTHLDASQREAMAALSIFRASFTRGAADAVSGVSLRTLTHLVNKSLLKRTPTGGRYGQHDLLREYAAAKLPPEREASAREAHARHYARLVRDHERLCRGGRQVHALEALDLEIDNIRAAWDWCVECRQWTILSELFEGLYQFHDMKGLYQLGEGLFRRAAEAAATAGDGEILWAKLLSRQGRFLFQLGEPGRARLLLERSLAMLRAADSKGEVAYCLHNLADVAAVLGDYDSSEELAREGLRISESLGDRAGMGTALNNLGVVFYHRQDYEEAERLFRESLDVSRSAGDQWGVGLAPNNLGVLFHDLRQFEQAETCYRESLTCCETLGDAHGVTAALVNLGRVRTELGDLESAWELSSRGLEQAARLGDPWTMAASTVNLGEIARARGRPGDAEQLFVSGLRQARAIRATALSLEGLVGLADLVAQRGKTADAIVWLRRVIAHSAADRDTQERARRLLDILGAETEVTGPIGPSPGLDQIMDRIVTEGVD